MLASNSELVTGTAVERESSRVKSGQPGRCGLGAQCYACEKLMVMIQDEGDITKIRLPHETVGLHHP